MNKWNEQLCKIERVRRRRSDFCPSGQGGNCARAEQFQKLDDQGNTQYVADVDHTQQDYSSVVFNAFIFMQVSTLKIQLALFMYILSRMKLG